MSGLRVSIFFDVERQDRVELIKLGPTVALELRTGQDREQLTIFLHTKGDARTLIEACTEALEQLPESVPGYDQLTLADVMPGALVELEGY